MKSYIAIRNPNNGIVEVTVKQSGSNWRYPLPHIVRHSPTGFNFGYGGSGPAELARCILIDWFDGDTEKADNANYQKFKDWFVAPPQGLEFNVSGEAIKDWLEAQKNPGVVKQYGKLKGTFNTQCFDCGAIVKGVPIGVVNALCEKHRRDADE